MKNIPFVLALFTTMVYSSESGFSFYSGSLLFKPLAANTFEARVGLIWHSNDNRLRLDIGNSVDMIQYVFEDPDKHLTIGSDFFTYTLLRGEKNFHFPVDAVDYLFGFNVNYTDSLESGVLSSRLRLSHISAHFVDGHFDGTSGTWKDGLNPLVYSREFFDLAVAFEPMDNFRGYAGAIYLWHVDPSPLSKFAGYLGGEYRQNVSSVFIGFIAYQLTAATSIPRHEIQMGTKIGSWHGRGTKLFFIYHYGNSIHGEYYPHKDEYSGVGFNVDF